MSLTPFSIDHLVRTIDHIINQQIVVNYFMQHIMLQDIAETLLIN